MEPVLGVSSLQQWILSTFWMTYLDVDIGYHTNPQIIWRIETLLCLSTNSTHMDGMHFVLLRKALWKKFPSQIKYLKNMFRFLFKLASIIITHHIL